MHCLHCLTDVAVCLASSVWWISFKTIFHLFNLNSLDHKCCGWRSIPALPCDNYFLSWGPTLHSLLLVSPSIFNKFLWKTRHFSQVGHESHIASVKDTTYQIYNSTSDDVRSFTFIDELYNVMFVKDLSIPKPFLYTYRSNPPFTSNFVSATSYICFGHELGINLKYTYCYIYIYIYACVKLGCSLSFKQVWLNNKDSFCLYNFITIISSFLISVLVSGWNWWMSFGKFIYQFQPETKTLIRKLERILIKLYRQNVSLLFN